MNRHVSLSLGEPRGAFLLLELGHDGEVDCFFHGESCPLRCDQQSRFTVRAEVEFHHHAVTLPAAFALPLAYFC